MNKIWIVVQREYVQRVKTKAFVVGTVLGPLLMIGYILFVFFIARLESGELRRIAIVAGEEQVAARVREILAPQDSKERAKFEIRLYSRQGKSKEELVRELNAQVNAEELDAFVYLEPDFLAVQEVEYYSRSVGNTTEIRALRQALSDIRTERRLGAEGLDPQRIREMIKPLQMKTIKVSEEGAREETASQLAVGFVAVFIQYMMIVMYGMAVMRGVIEEKGSRMVEVILSSLRPFQYMIGKIVGVGAAGLTQVLVWTVSGLLLSLYGGALYLAFMGSGAAQADLPTLPFSVLWALLLYFFLGYFLYATLYAAIGSAVNSEQEAQNLQMPVTILVVLPMLLLGFVMRAPDSQLATTLSLVPLFTPVLMLMRICILTPPAWQIGLSIVLTLAFTLLLVWAASRIYRVGILMYGKKPTIPELLRWLRQS